MDKKHTVAFLFLDEIHHLYHFVSVAVSLSEKHNVHILTYPGEHKLLFETLERLNGENVIVEQLKTHWFRAFTDKLKKREMPRKGFWLKKNMNYLLENFDAVVFTDYYHHYLLKARKNNPFPKLVKLSHGTPGRAYSFNKDLLDFDFQVLVGKYQRKRLNKLNYLSEHYAVAGYPKIDVIDLKNKERFFDNDKPVVLYNPHFDARVSSWHTEGLKVLEFFCNQKEYNLIFAPHVHLFKEKGGVPVENIPQKYVEAANIHIDAGSNKSIDMSYTKAADVYLGDVSSQVFEFIINPRPCIFLNSHQIKYKKDKNYRFWKCGDVIESGEELPEALANCFDRFKIYKPIQKKITSKNFFTKKKTTASQRYADAIETYLDGIVEN